MASRVFSLATAAFMASACSSLSGLSGGDDSEGPAAGAGTDKLATGEDRIRTVTSVDTPLRGEAAPRGITVTTRAVVWVDSGDRTVRRLGFGETTPRTIATLKGAPIDVLADFDDLYVHRQPLGPCDGVVERMREDGSQSTTVSTQCDGYQRIALDATSLVASVTTQTSNGTRSSIAIRSKDPGTSPTSLFEDRNIPGAIRSDGTRMYWVREGSRTIMSAPKTSDVAQVVLVATSPSKPVDLALDKDFVYWVAEGGEVLATPKSGPPDTPPRVIAVGEGSPTRLVIAGGYVYWTASGSGLVRRARRVDAGGDPAPQTIAEGLVQPFGIAAAPDAIWVTTRQGDLVRINLAP